MALPPRVRTWLIALHWASVLIHLTTGVFGLYINMLRDNEGQKLSYEDVTWYASGQVPANMTTPIDQCNVRELPDGGLVMYERTCADGQWNGILSLTVCKLFTAVAHLWYLWELRENYRWSKWYETDQHFSRWIEYSVTATLLTLSQLIPLGIRSVYLVIFVAMVFPCMLLVGGIGEKAFAMRRRVKSRDPDQASSLGFIQWGCFAIAWLIQGSVFVLIGIALARSTGDGTEDDSSDYLWRMVASVYYLFYFSFPVIYILWFKKVFKAFWQAEICYIILSLTSKTALFWIITSALEYIRTDHGGWEVGVFVSSSVPLALGIILPPLILRGFLSEEWTTARDASDVADLSGTISAPNAGTTSTELQRLLDAQ